MNQENGRYKIRFAFTIVNDISTIEDLVLFGMLQNGEVLSGEGENDRQLTLHVIVVGTHHFIGISRSEEMNIGHSTNHSELLNRLMRRTILTHT